MVEIEEVDGAPPASRPRGPPKASEGGDDDDEDLDLGACGWCCCISFVLIIVGLVVYLWTTGEPYRKLKVEAFHNDEVLRTVVWPQGGNYAKGGPNGPDVDWAIFFYKPYCGACRRVRPIFHALARTTNATSHLRFGEVDCVKYRGVCNMLGVETQPRVRLYKAAGGAEAAKAMVKEAKAANSRVQNRWKRESAAEWQGMLIAYEISAWFYQLQADKSSAPLPAPPLRLHYSPPASPRRHPLCRRTGCCRSRSAGRRRTTWARRCASSRPRATRSTTSRARSGPRTLQAT